MENRILTERQRLFIDNLPDEILTSFYLTGGTALSAFYMEHRFSEDLDLFTDAEDLMPPVEFLTGLLKALFPSQTMRYQRLFDRRIFAATFDDGDVLKVEFTVYPFKSVEKRRKTGGLTVDSLLNMATGKLFAMTDRFDPKDFVDLYFFLHRYEWGLNDLIAITGERFGIKGLDFVIPERLLMVKRVKPDGLPNMIEEVDLEEMKEFFLGQSLRLVKSRVRP